MNFDEIEVLVRIASLNPEPKVDDENRSGDEFVMNFDEFGVSSVFLVCLVPVLVKIVRRGRVRHASGLQACVRQGGFEILPYLARLCGSSEVSG
jgi:hypothetical protein